jgi:CDP-glycerol glycerophosphotransferase (TagB/SpsB family)
MHPNEEDSGIYEKFVDDKTIFYAGQDRSNSSLELLAHVDVLVTDYSSIYMDFLPFDRPIVFVKDRHDRFEDQRGLAFNYDRYFPGKTVDSTDEFLEHLDTCLSGNEGYDDERAFVRKVLLPRWDGSTVDKLLQYAGMVEDTDDPPKKLQ